MMEQPPAYQTRRSALPRYQIPTHLKVSDKILSVWGFGLTVRQLLILLIAWSAVANTWVRLAAPLSTLGTTGSVLHLVVTAIPGMLLLFVAFKQVADRPLEVWLLVLLRYWLQPKIYLWRSVRGLGRAEPTDAEPESLPEEDWSAHDVVTDLWLP